MDSCPNNLRTTLKRKQRVTRHIAYFARAVHSHSHLPADNAFSMGKKTPSRRYAMRPIVNMSEEDGATDTDNMHKKW